MGFTFLKLSSYTTIYGLHQQKELNTEQFLYKILIEVNSMHIYSTV